MKRTNDALNATLNRRAMIQNHDDLLDDPEVVAFLDSTSTPEYTTLSKKLLEANEPALLLELARVAQVSELDLQLQEDDGSRLDLPDGLLDHVLQHLPQLAGLTSLSVGDAVLSAAACAHLQTALKAPGCSLHTLEFFDCSFADAQAQFPTTAATIRNLLWEDDREDEEEPPAFARVLPALALWSSLEHLSLTSPEEPIDFALIAQLLLANPRINSLRVESNASPQGPNHDPALLLDLLARNRVRLIDLEFFVGAWADEPFNERCLRQLAACLMSNTTLESIDVPGIKICTPAAKDRFIRDLNANHNLIEFGPENILDGWTPAPVRRNQSHRVWFTEGFVTGAVQALMAMFHAPHDAGQQVASHLTTTAADRVYCGAAMALVCQSTHQRAVKLRSQFFKDEVRKFIREDKEKECLELLNSLLKHKIDLLPGDKQLVIECAAKLKRLNWLPEGYAH